MQRFNFFHDNMEDCEIPKEVMEVIKGKMRKVGDKVSVNGEEGVFEIASVFRGSDGESAYKLIYEDSTEVYGIVSEEDVEDYTPPRKLHVHGQGART